MSEFVSKGFWEKKLKEQKKYGAWGDRSDGSIDSGRKSKSKALESKKFHEGLKADREIYARRKLNKAEHKSFSMTRR